MDGGKSFYESFCKDFEVGLAPTEPPVAPRKSANQPHWLETALGKKQTQRFLVEFKNASGRPFQNAVLQREDIAKVVEQALPILLKRTRLIKDAKNLAWLGVASKHYWLIDSALNSDDSYSSVGARKELQRDLKFTAALQELFGKEMAAEILTGTGIYGIDDRQHSDLWQDIECAIARIR